MLSCCALLFKIVCYWLCWLRLHVMFLVIVCLTKLRVLPTNVDLRLWTLARLL